MKTKLLLVLIFCSTAVFGQIRNQKGSLILQNGNVLNGSITYYYDDPANILFLTEEGAKQVFAPKQVHEIKLNNGEKFVARPYSSAGEDSTTLILQALIESSKISLYTREDVAQRLFYVSKDNVIYRLENNEIIIDEGSSKYKRKDYRYVGILSSLMTGRFDLVEKINRLKLNEHDLTDIILEYNKGDVSYEWRLNNKEAKEANWVLFTQYSQYGSMYGDVTTSYSFGQMVGLQYYFSRHSRHSIKFSFDYSKINLDNEDLEVKGLGLRYQQDLKKAEKYSLYFLLHLIDAVHATRMHENNSQAESRFLLRPRMSPGIGLEAKPFPKLAVYAELNNFILLKVIPRSFSVGLKYDLGKTNW